MQILEIMSGGESPIDSADYVSEYRSISKKKKKKNVY